MTRCKCYKPGVTDANVFGERGIPCLHLGPARGNVHQPNEYVSLEWLELLPRMYTLIAARFLGSGFSSTGFSVGPSHAPGWSG